jgi:hypothetical protein
MTDKLVLDQMTRDQILASQPSQIIAVFESYYAEIRSYYVELDANPVGAGLASLHEKLQYSRNAANRVSDLLGYAIKIRAALEFRSDAAKKLLDLSITRKLHEMKEDPEVKKARSKEERHQLVLPHLETEAKAADTDKDLLRQAKAFESVVKLKHDQLDKTRSDLLTQLGVIKVQSGLHEVNISNHVPNGQVRI